MHHNPTRRCAQLDVCCAVGPNQRPWSKVHPAAVIVGDASLAIPLNADAVPAYLPESLLPDPPSLTGPPCPLSTTVTVRAAAFQAWLPETHELATRVFELEAAVA